MINHNIKGTNITITPELRSYVEKKLGVAEKFLSGDTTVHADAELEYDFRRDPSAAEAPKGKGGKYRAEFNLSLRGGLYRAEEWGSSLHEAIDLAINGLVNELRRTKKKHLHLVRRGAGVIKDMMRGLYDRF